MAIDKEDVEYIAHLARLSLSEEEKVQMKKDLNDIVGYMSKLNELDLDKVEAKEHVIERSNSFHSKDADDNYFRVPKVIE